MSAKDDYTPDWSRNHQWTEYDWEMAMRQSDKFANKYFELLEKYGELPGSDDVILKKLTHITPPQMLEEDDYYIELNSEDVDEIENSEDEDYEDGFYYENTPVYMLLRQVSIGWCNIYATFLLPDHRKYGVNILFHLGRGMAHLVGCLGDGEYENPSANIASCKRALDQVNQAMGLVQQLPQLRPAYSKVTDTIIKHLCEIQGKIVDHLFLLRKKCEERKGL